MDNLINKVSPDSREIRTGKAIDMDAYLEDIDKEYACDLKASIEAYDDYETVSAETYNDLLNVKTALAILEHLGYLTRHEHDEIVKVAEEIRLIALKELEREEKV